jgi:flagellar hook-associated protein 1 FlgK
VPYSAGMTISFNNMTFSMSGNPGDGDTFTVGPNTNGTGDNRNLLLMNALQNQNLVGNGSATLESAYASMVDMVGNTTSQLNTTGQTETNLLNAATKQQQSVSGVNLDQETVNLMQYQQVYEACGKLIQVAGQNFSTVLALDGSGGAG